MPGSWTGVEPITFEYQWQRCSSGSCSDIAGATSSTYTVGNDEVGSSLTVVETATSIAGTSTATAPETGVVPDPPEAPVNTVLPVVSGSVEVGGVLSTTNGTWTGTDPITFTYQWQRCSSTCGDIAGGTASTYTVASGDVGLTLSVVVTGTNAVGSSSASAVETVVVPGPPVNTFVDDDGNIHESAIEAIAAAGITKGCNPPTNDKYCPDDPVTRGAMAAFLNRALNLDPTGIDYFNDDTGSVFEGDINRLAAAGITKGCNPPTNDEYCPNAPVTRGAMAAFLNRALNLAPTGLDYFNDDTGSVFEGDINRLAAAGITKGCNPPTNDQYCPNRPVTRAEMATFLARALKLDV